MAGNAVKECRICMEEGISEEGDEWLAPCRCSGTLKWVHRKCLKKWVEGYAEKSELAKLTRKHTCSLCKSVYHSRRSLKPMRNWSFSPGKLSLIVFGEPLCQRFFRTLGAALLSFLMRMALSLVIGGGIEQWIITFLLTMVFNTRNIHDIWKRWNELCWFIDDALFTWTIDNASGGE